MQRRNFIRSGLLLSVSYTLLPGFNSIAYDDHFIMTVNGSIPASQMGFTLSHEHVLVDFIGADKIQAGRYNEKTPSIGHCLFYRKQWETAVKLW